jgi:hypothetical protein
MNICWNDSILRGKVLGIKLKVIQLKLENIKILKLIRTIIKIMEYDVKISHVIFRVFSVV